MRRRKTREAGRSKIQPRERLSREEGVITKDWGGRLPIALIYPNTYYLGMSNLGIQAIYRLLNRHDRIVAERVFGKKRTGRKNRLPFPWNRGGRWSTSPCWPFPPLTSSIISISYPS